MTELKQLRELVRLAEAAEALYTSKGLARSPVNPKLSIRLPDFKCATS